MGNATVKTKWQPSERQRADMDAANRERAMRSARAAFLATVPDGMPDGERDARWNDLIGRVSAGREAQALSVADWCRVQALAGTPTPDAADAT